MITVLVTTYRRPHFLAAAMESLQHQTFTDWQAVVVDNEPRRRIHECVPALKDDRVRYIPAARNLGECGGRNAALEHADGEFVCYLDDDDVLPRDSLALRLAFSRSVPERDMIYGEYELLGIPQALNTRTRAATPVTKEFYDPLLDRAGFEPSVVQSLLRCFNFVRGGTPLIRRTFLEHLNGFDERFTVYGDYDLWLRVASAGRLAFLPEVVYRYRVHRGSTHLCALRRGDDERFAVLLCRTHGITRSVQFARYQRSIEALGKPRPDTSGVPNSDCDGNDA